MENVDIWKNNIAELCGTLAQAPKLSHISRDEKYYVFPLEIGRLSGTIDRVNITASEQLLRECVLDASPHIRVLGELRSFNNKSGVGSKLVLSVYARSLTPTDEEAHNRLFLSGILCKAPNLRRTPLGRDICDLMLAVNRRYGRSDYLPCIAWGRNAQTAAQLKVGDPLTLNGRLQSRTYVKVENGESVEKTAFEVSIIDFAEQQ